MTGLGIEQVSGDLFRMKTTSSRHVMGMNETPLDEGKKDFGSLLADSLQDVNGLQQDYAALSQQAITNPESVDPHDITIAGAEANLALNITKNVIDRVIRAYKDLTTLR